jgi:uncharacterized protein with PIN domain
MGAYVSLLEYNGIEGMILLSELSRRRIRSITKLIKVSSISQQCMDAVERFNLMPSYTNTSCTRCPSKTFLVAVAQAEAARVVAAAAAGALRDRRYSEAQAEAGSCSSISNCEDIKRVLCTTASSCAFSWSSSSSYVLVLQRIVLSSMQALEFWRQAYK